MTENYANQRSTDYEILASQTISRKLKCPIALERIIRVNGTSGRHKFRTWRICLFIYLNRLCDMKQKQNITKYSKT